MSILKSCQEGGNFMDGFKFYRIPDVPWHFADQMLPSQRFLCYLIWIYFVSDFSGVVPSHPSRSEHFLVMHCSHFTEHTHVGSWWISVPESWKTYENPSPTFQWISRETDQTWVGDIYIWSSALAWLPYIYGKIWKNQILGKNSEIQNPIYTDQKSNIQTWAKNLAPIGTRSRCLTQKACSIHQGVDVRK